MTIDVPELATLVESLPTGLLPPGRLVPPAGGGPPRYWLSDAPAAPGLWSRLRAEHPGSGLWPLLLDGLRGEPTRPWADGEVDPDLVTSHDGHDPDEVLAEWWAGCTTPEGHDQPTPSVIAPFGPAWPGLAPAGVLTEPPDRCAANYLALGWHDSARLGLVPAGRGADAVAVAGWSGPVNHAADSGMIAAVLRSWEARFGARVVHVGFDTLDLSIAAPPAPGAHALQVAAEHFAFCPDNIWQDSGPIRAYADRLVDAPCWSFWWD